MESENSEWKNKQIKPKLFLESSRAFKRNNLKRFNLIDVLPDEFVL